MQTKYTNVVNDGALMNQFGNEPGKTWPFLQSYIAMDELITPLPDDFDLLGVGNPGQKSSSRLWCMVFFRSSLTTRTSSDVLPPPLNSVFFPWPFGRPSRRRLSGGSRMVVLSLDALDT